MELINLLKGDLKMNEEIKDMLGEEIRAEIRDLSTLEAGSDEKSKAIEDLAVLYKLRIEETKNELDADERYSKNAVDSAQLTEQVKDRYFRLGIEIAGLVVPLIFYAAWMKRGFKFEETGTYVSPTFKGLIKWFKPTRK